MQCPVCTPETGWQKHPFVTDLPGQNGTVQQRALGLVGAAFVHWWVEFLDWRFVSNHQLHAIIRRAHLMHATIPV